MTSFDSLQFGISLAFKCKAWPGNSFPLPPFFLLPLPICCHALEDCKPKSLSRSCVWRRRTHKAQQTIAKHLHGHTQCDEFVRNQNRIKGQKVHITRTGEGARTGVGGTHFFLVFGRAGWLTFTPCGTLAVHASQSQTQSRPKELSQNSGNNNKQQIAPNL